jgi:hypothetical protein
MAAKAQAAVLGLALVLAAAAAQAADCPVSSLGWIVGAWQFRNETRVVKEHWSATSSGQLMGLTWSEIGRGDAVKLATIVNENGKLILRERHFDMALTHASEDRDKPIVFAASSCGPGFVTFEGQGEWAGGRVTFRHVGDTLDLSGDVHDKGAPGHYHTIFTRE